MERLWKDLKEIIYVAMQQINKLQRTQEYLVEKHISLFLLKDKANKSNNVFYLVSHSNFALVNIDIGLYECVWH